MCFVCIGKTLTDHEADRKAAQEEIGRLKSLAQKAYEAQNVGELTEHLKAMIGEK
jgi:bacterioferritin-associated ferredoxin